MFTRLRDLREDHDLKQETLAAELGIRQTTYSKYELGKIAVPASALIRIADFYHVSLDYLVGRVPGLPRPSPSGPACTAISRARNTGCSTTPPIPRRWSRWWSIRPCTGSGASGYAPPPCGANTWNGTAIPDPDLPI